MNQVEIWFSMLHRQALRRGVFRNLGSLVTAINRFHGGVERELSAFRFGQDG
jgi:hypothetical protein